MLEWSTHPSREFGDGSAVVANAIIAISILVEIDIED
jgi:hypothetical protein